MSLVYLALLVGSAGCLALVDHRFRLFLWRAPKRAAVVLAIGVAFFLVWDLVGIAFGVFVRGDNAISTGLLLAPHLPVEELVFLLFLSYVTMVLYTGALRLAERRRA
ncbi:lycopene cyclase domain-containing protein [Agromyces sp. MMS24-K17]|uniref:lycopene cyclase domain-containing protein n=1 Tax=Agromyces sp. MMS24-K17 TaxID=3372850 RepID=UPI003754F7A8